MSEQRPKPVVLIILDGWGVAPPGEGNALTRAQTPHLDRYVHTYPVMTLLASGMEVGLKWGEMGNSEVGHLNIGAGRVYYQTLPRIETSIDNGTFFENSVLIGAMERGQQSGRLHIMGILSDGDVHGSLAHIQAVLEMAKDYGIKEVYVHGFLDGRDVHYRSARGYIEKLENIMKEVGVGAIASVGGRRWGMDRDNRWDRVEKAYRTMVWDGAGDAPPVTDSVLKAIDVSYEAEIFDEEIEPVCVVRKGKPVGSIRSGDPIVFTNFRADRARQITKAFVLPDFDRFERSIDDVYFVCMTEYEDNLPVAGIVFEPHVVTNSIAEVIAKAGMKQFHIAETEKYAHVTFFLNGTREEPFPGEDHEIVPSPMVERYNEQPAMASAEIAQHAVIAIESGVYDAMFINFANGDMVGHTGDVSATIVAAEEVDTAIGNIVEATLAHGGVVLITADHGNAENAINLQTGEKDKEHTTNPVPFFIIGAQWEGQTSPSGDPPEGDLSLLAPVGVLADVAPTMLAIMGLEQPPEMTGRNLM